MSDSERSATIQAAIKRITLAEFLKNDPEDIAAMIVDGVSAAKAYYIGKALISKAIDTVRKSK
jgi:hypothetical protein